MSKTIAVDGPAGSGKSSIAKLLADKIDFNYFDTGLMYRAITYFFIKEKISSKDEANIELKIPTLDLVLKDSEIHLNAENITEFLKSDEVTKEVANYAKIKSVRKHIQFIQRKFAAENNCVMDGRDIGSVVAPDAFCKFYLDADVEERSKRRFEELSKNNSEKTLDEIKKEIILRDHIDRTRKESPLKIPPDAVVIDSSHLSLEEVLTKMIDHYNEQLDLINIDVDGDKNNFFLQALETSIQEKNPSTTKILKGKVVKIENNEIIIDIGEKIDAYIENEESKVLLKDNQIAIGEELEVIRLETSQKGIKVSKLIVDKNKTRLLIEKAFLEKQEITGKVEKVIKGGFIINIDENSAFCPYSEFDIKKINSEEQVGKVLNFNILELQGKKIILSRKKIVQEIQDKNKKEFFKELKVGMIISGEVVSFLRSGALLKIKEGVVLLLRNDDISWRYISNASKVLEKNQSVEVKVIEIDEENQRVRISKKELDPDPLIAFSEVYKEGDTIDGKVRRIESFGAFLSLNEDLDGLLHVSNLSWYRKVEHPNQIVKKGQDLKVKILRIDVRQRKISLGLREMEPDPWGAMEQVYPAGMVVFGKVFSVIKSGIYVLIDNRIEGFIHISDTHFASDTDLKEKFKENDEVFGFVKSVYKSKKRVELILKEKSDDPWKDFANSFRKEVVLRGKIKEIADNGVSVEIFEGLVGFCHKSQLTLNQDDKEFSIEEEVKLDDYYNFTVQSFNEEKKVLRLSRKDYLEQQEKKDIKQYFKNDSTRFTVSDFIQKKN